jgi:DNA-binding transcriptional LysR family regulator
MTTPSIKQLEAFYSAATCANFATAASRLHLSVSSLSKRITELEQALGQSVFDRSGHKAVLTHGGQLLLPAARQVLDAMSALQGTFAVEGGLTGRCCFGVGELSALTWLPRFVARIRQQHPALSVEPYVDVGAVLEQRVARGELDFAVIAGRSSRSAVLSQPIATARFEWVASSALATGDGTLTPALLQSVPLITLPPGAGTTRILDDWLLSQGVAADKRIECNNWSAIAGMLEEGLGIGFLPEGWATRRTQGTPATDSPEALLQVLESSPALAPLHYAFQWRRDDRRELILRMRELLATCIDFSGRTGRPV